MTSYYPKPGPMGGKILRNMVKTLRNAGVSLPISSHILCGLSSGPDSTALAHLLSTYGRRIVDKGNLSLGHVNHQWRGEQSFQEEASAQDLANLWNIPFRSCRLRGPEHLEPGVSWENHYRMERHGALLKMAQEGAGDGKPFFIATGHHGDDLAETLLWKILTGEDPEGEEGIRVVHGPFLRPLLGVRKQEILAYLEEENLPYHGDPSNGDPRFLRAKMREKLMPALQEIFPRGVQHLMAQALARQTPGEPEKNKNRGVDLDLLEILMKGEISRPRRVHFNGIKALKSAPGGEVRTLHLPEGWQLKHQIVKKSSDSLTLDQRGTNLEERWTLERPVHSSDQ